MAQSVNSLVPKKYFTRNANSIIFQNLVNLSEINSILTIAYTGRPKIYFKLSLNWIGAVCWGVLLIRSILGKNSHSCQSVNIPVDIEFSGLHRYISLCRVIAIIYENVIMLGDKVSGFWFDSCCFQLSLLIWKRVRWKGIYVCVYKISLLFHVNYCFIYYRMCNKFNVQNTCFKK